MSKSPEPEAADIDVEDVVKDDDDRDVSGEKDAEPNGRERSPSPRARSVSPARSVSRSPSRSPVCIPLFQVVCPSSDKAARSKRPCFAFDHGHRPQGNV